MGVAPVILPKEVVHAVGLYARTLPFEKHEVLECSKHDDRYEVIVGFNYSKNTIEDMRSRHPPDELEDFDIFVSESLKQKLTIDGDRVVEIKNINTFISGR